MLLIDDEDIAAALVESYLRLLRIPVEFTWIRTPEEALVRIKEQTWKLLFVDIAFRLETTRGISLIKEIKQTLGDDSGYVVALTQLDLSHDEKTRCLEAGACDILSKWPKKAEMQRLLEKWLDEENQSLETWCQQAMGQIVQFLRGLLPASPRRIWE